MKKKFSFVFFFSGCFSFPHIEKWEFFCCCCLFCNMLKFNYVFPKICHFTLHLKIQSGWKESAINYVTWLKITNLTQHTALPFTFHHAQTDGSLESFYKVKGDAAQQKEPPWEAEQFCGIKKQLCEEGLFQGTGLDPWLVSWLWWQRGGGTSPGLCAPPLHPGMGTLTEQRKPGTKSTWEMGWERMD